MIASNLFAIVLLLGVTGVSLGYEGYQVIRLELKNKRHIMEMREYGEKLQLDFWREPAVGQPTDVMVSATTKDKVVEYAKRNSIKYSVHISDVHRLLKRSMSENKLAQLLTDRKRQPHRTVSSFYFNHQQVNSWVSFMKRNYKFCSSFSLGKSYEKRDMRVLKISTGKGKPVVFIDAGIHAREWLAPASFIYLVNKLIVQYAAGDSVARSILDKYEIQFLPVANPDGYDYSHKSAETRLWRKTRQPHGNCFGADPNRNFDIDFAGSGTSPNPCSDIFPGPKPFSEPEARNIRDHFLSNKNNIKVYLTAHAYSQMWFIPYGYSKKNAPDHVELRRIAQLGADAIEKTNGLKFTVGSPAQILYEASGGSDDWAYEKVGVKYTFGFEVRPTVQSKYGFAAPVSWIKPAGEEMYNGVMTALKAINP